MFCPLLVLTHRLISALNAELCYAYFLVLFSFYFIAIFCVLIGTIYSIQRGGNIFDKSKYEEREVLQKLRAQGNRNVADTFLQSHIKHLLSSIHIYNIGKRIIIGLYTIFLFNPL